MRSHNEPLRNLMQAHNESLRAALLHLGDAFDSFAAQATRARLRTQVAMARMMRGLPPVELPAGPATAHEVIEDGPLARLVRYPAQGTRRAHPILVVASLINRYYVLDLLPERSLIALLASRGFDVWVLDWKSPGAAGPSLGFADYVDGAIGQAARATGSKQVALLGYCMGGTLAAMFAARHAPSVRALALLGTPIDFHASGELATWTQRDRFDADLLMDVLGNMPPTLMQSGFKLLSPFDALSRAVALTKAADDEPTLRQLVALESWLEDNVAFPGGVYREYIGGLYQDNALVDGKFRIAGEAVDLGKLTAPLLNVVALRDKICEPPSSRALMERVGSTDKQLVEFDVGHIGLSTSGRAQAKLWPRIADWYVERAG